MCIQTVDGQYCPNSLTESTTPRLLELALGGGSTRAQAFQRCRAQTFGASLLIIRRYHAFRAGNWIVYVDVPLYSDDRLHVVSPNDEIEQNRMDLLHHIWKSSLGGECLKFGGCVDRIDRVLDVGTGTGQSEIISG